MPLQNHDILSALEYWAFRVGLLIVFVAWILRHVVHELKALIPALRELRQIWKSQPEPSKVVHTQSP